MPRSLRRDDEAVTEVIGYVLSFALSAIFLLIALNVFHAARANTEEVVTGVELKSITDRVAGRVVELGLVAQEFPDVQMNVTLDIPQSLNGRLYTITATASAVTAATNDGEISVRSTTFKTNEVETGGLPIVIWGSVDSSNEVVRVQYSLTNGIKISGE